MTEHGVTNYEAMLRRYEVNLDMTNRLRRCVMSGMQVPEVKHDYHIHDHEDITGRKNFRHDHASDKYPNGHRHLSERSRMVLPPTVEGCEAKTEKTADCYVAAAEGDITFSERCGPCRDAWRV